MFTTFTDTNFQKEALDFPGVVMIDFWATWCPPCRIQGPIVEKLAQKLSSNSQIKIGKLDVDNNPQIQAAFSIMSIPTLIFFKNGKVVDSLVGLRSEEELDQKLQALAK